MKRQIIGYNVYNAPEGCSESYYGFAATLADARKLAAKGKGRALEASLYDTARAAGHCAGLSAPDKTNEADEPEEWFGDDGFDCAVRVYASEIAAVLMSYGDRFAGNNPEGVAQDWADNDFDADGVAEWCEIGVWDASTAAQLRDAGLTPDDAKAASDHASGVR